MREYEQGPPRLAVELEQFFAERFPDARVGLHEGLVFDWEVTVNGYRAASVPKEACEFYERTRV